ncbi:MAG: response regulator [Persicimonas sp.]
MSTDVESRGEELAGDLEQVRQTFEALAERDELEGEGYRAVAEGLARMLETVDLDVEANRTRLAVVSRGLQTLAELLEEGQLGEEAEQFEPEDEAEEFREMFRKDARKRLSGLSISMMGLFSEDGGEEAIKQTSDHLHAMKGGSAMVGLDQFSQLVASMEQVVVEMQRQPRGERTWPIRALLQGFQVLDRAVSDPELAVDEQAAAEIIRALEACRDASSSATPSAPRRQPAGHSEQSASESATVDASTAADEGGASGYDLSDYDGPLEKRILIVDDVETIAASVGFVLSELEVPIEMAEHGEEALEMLRERPYSLVISDVSMPRMDGVALTKMIRSDERMSEIPVILLTSLDRPDERDAGIEAGATDYIIKGSIGGGELLGRVKELLEIAPDVPASDFGGDGDLYQVLVAEDVETIAASIAFVLSEGPFEIEIARNGAAALERLRSENYDVLLSDVQMPEMSGLELLEAIRADDDLSKLPVILLTSLQDEEVQEQALDIGADRFLIKGEVAGESLRGIIEEVVHRSDEEAHAP